MKELSFGSDKFLEFAKFRKMAQCGGNDNS